MKFYVLTLFPEMIDGGLSHSILGRARKSGAIEIECVDIRAFSKNKQRHVDDYPYGGGCGMVMQAQPIYDAFRSLETNARVLYMTPQGAPFCQQKAAELSKEEEIVLLCGHYEGVDERVIEEIVTDEISLGDFVLTGGEIAAMAVIDAVARLRPGVLGKDESSADESFSNNALEYPQYTRPPEFRGRRVPDILLSGHHENIEKWRREQSLIRTYEKRPDLYRSLELSKKEKEFMEKYIANKAGRK